MLEYSFASDFVFLAKYYRLLGHEDGNCILNLIIFLFLRHKNTNTFILFQDVYV